ncbi:MAG: phosphotransferase family protein [Phenylobacterium sp.]|uniref:phosphotransferase family protein n=1 Tax=Phenylobacterium sp. TaxID=1871053 RepID=UPI003919CAC7
MSNLVAEGLAGLGPRLAGDGAQLEGPTRLSGGASMETWAFAYVTPQGRRELILRRRPGGAPPPDADGRANGLAVEAALIRAAAAAGVPAPPVVHVCEPGDGLGEAYVMGRVEGETLGRKIVGDARFDAVRPKLARQCGQILARIHATPPPAGLDLRVADAADELDKYEEIYRSSGAQRPILELAFRHLRGRLPPPLAPRLVHGDFRNGNLMFDPDAGVVAVLDWELTHVGDPAEDLGWLCVNSWRFGRADRPVGGFGDYAELLTGYAEAGGQGIDLDRVLFWQALGSLKWGVMCLIMYMSFRTNTEAGVERAVIGRRVSETEIDIVRILERGL